MKTNKVKISEWCKYTRFEWKDEYETHYNFEVRNVAKANKQSPLQFNITEFKNRRKHMSFSLPIEVMDKLIEAIKKDVSNT